MGKYLVFVSYTMRRKDVDYIFLCTLKQILSSYDLIETYVDKLDNHAINHQEYVITKLCSSDVVLLLNTPNINISKWVQKELSIAIQNNIPIVKFEAEQIQNSITDSQKLEYVVNTLIEAAKNKTCVSLVGQE